MFECKFAKMYDNTIFTKCGVPTVPEDHFKVQNNIFCVADGVTRDDVNGNPVGYPQNEKEVLDWIKRYPNPSGAKEAAKIASENFVQYVAEYPEEKITKQVILDIIKKVNEDIWEINKDRQIDYLKEDLYCTEAVGGIIIKNTLYAFSIGDCHITVLDETLNPVFTTINNHKQFEDYIDFVYTKKNTFDWNNPNDRKMVRKEYRNNPNQKYEGKDVSFGALSGEKQAEYFLDVYEVDLEKATYVCAYSDGCEPIFEDKEKLAQIIQHPESLKNEGKERTLILYEKKK